jgi:chemotaxis protein CheY-P-specific phosphatase CheC
VEQLQLDQLVARLEGAFGEEPPFSSRELEAGDLEVLKRVFGDEGYQVYLQDQVNRQIIRDYLVNAVMLGYVPEQDLADIRQQMMSHEGRAALSLDMLMSAVEQAGDVVAGAAAARLTRLKSATERPPYIKLIDS